MSGIDTKIGNQKENKEKTSVDIIENRQAISGFENRLKTLNAENSQSFIDLEILEQFLKTNQYLPEIEKEFTAWSIDFTNLRNNNTSINNENLLIEENKNLIEATNKDIEYNKLVSSN